MRVGDIVRIGQDDRVPADVVLLYTTEKSGSVFIRTDQLDGETDWKLRKAAAMTQATYDPDKLAQSDANVVANAPNDLIYDFKGVMESADQFGRETKEALSLENTLWANTVLASPGYVLALVTYTGKETRAHMNAKDPHTKVGKIDLEINRLAKFLFVFMLLLSLAIVAMDGFRGNVAINFFRFVLLFCTIIPISLRVNLELGKAYYSLLMYQDEAIPGTIARNSNIPEELGRI